MHSNDVSLLSLGRFFDFHRIFIHNPNPNLSCVPRDLEEDVPSRIQVATPLLSAG